MKTITLDVSGMTCAACAARIEKRLNKVDQVQATVNYATNRATVRVADEIKPETLIEVVEKAGYGAVESRPDTDINDPVPPLRRQVIVAGAGALPVIAISMVPVWQFPGWQWIALVATTIVLGYSGAPFHRSALINARHGTTTMDTLVSLGTLSAYCWSLVAMFFGTAGRLDLHHTFHLTLTRSSGLDNVYFEAAAGIIFFVLLGRFIEAKSRSSAGAAVSELHNLAAKTAVVVHDGAEVEVDIDQILVGNEFIVRANTIIATDGVVVSGQSALDTSLITGESLPVEAGVGDPVIGGTLNTHGRLVIRATQVGADTKLAQLARLVDEASAGKAAVQRLADRISGVFVPIVLVLAVATLLAWWLAGAGFAFAAQAAVAVVIIACPCALGLATPTALIVGSGRGAALGIAIKGPEVLERVRSVQTVFLDKTGTLTTKKMRLTTTAAVHRSWDEVLAFAAAAESGSEHPIARVLAEYAVREYELVDFENHSGLGVSAKIRVGGQIHTVMVGSADLLTDFSVPETLQVAAATAITRGETVVLIAVSGEVVGVIGLSGMVRSDAKAAVAELRHLGIEPVLLTGDHETAAQTVAEVVGIDRVLADVTPTEKAEIVTAEQIAVGQVAMVGDGVNDSAALMLADVGIALGSGTDTAKAAADIILLGGGIAQVATALRLSRAMMRTIHTNLFWAFGYNVAAIPLAALGFLNPMIAGAAMAFSSVFVVLNSLRLRRFR